MNFGPYKGTVISIHDGDTFRVQLQIPRSSRARDVGWDVTVAGACQIVVDVRLLGCNAPELRTPEGVLALDYLKTTMPPGTVVTLVSYGWDKYGGRTDSKITLPDGEDLTTVMLSSGHAVPMP